jgi:hypothetical protein
MSTADLYRQAFGQPAPVSPVPEPTPTVERIPRTVDGSTWYAYAERNGERIGATASTKRDALKRFSEQWGRFAR